MQSLLQYAVVLRHPGSAAFVHPGPVAFPLLADCLALPRASRFRTKLFSPMHMKDVGDLTAQCHCAYMTRVGDLTDRTAGRTRRTLTVLGDIIKLKSREHSPDD